MHDHQHLSNPLMKITLLNPVTINLPSSPGQGQALWALPLARSEHWWAKSCPGVVQVDTAAVSSWDTMCMLLFQSIPNYSSFTFFFFLFCNVLWIMEDMKWIFCQLLNTHFLLILITIVSLFQPWFTCIFSATAYQTHTHTTIPHTPNVFIHRLSESWSS